MATVRDYLGWYRSANAEQRTEGSTKFAEYIISACWKKMERRIGHWASVGLMYCLSEVKLDQKRVSHQWQIKREVLATKKSDIKLSLYLQAMMRNESLEMVLSYYEYDIPFNATIPPKDDITQAKIVLPGLQRLCVTDPRDLYNDTTAIEFHHLLVATMLSYANALQDLRKEHNLLMEVDNKNKKGEKTTLKEKLNLEKDERRKSKAIFKSQRKSEEIDLQSAMAVLDGFATQAAGGEEEEMQMGKKNRLSEDHTFPPIMSQNLNSTPSSPDDDGEKTPNHTISDAARKVVFNTRLLNAILVSGAFQRHINFLAVLNSLRVPIDTQQPDFFDFAKEKGIPWQ